MIEKTLRLFCAGAAKGLVEALEPRFTDEAGARIEATFGAVGSLKAKLDSGERCDVVVLTAKLIDALVAEDRVLSDTVAALGSVRTGIAVRDGDRSPDIGDAASLRASLLAAGTIYFPDPERATAGVHFKNVLRELGIDQMLAARLRTFANGATAMRALADDGQNGDVGCTQITEIRYTRGVVAVGPLPVAFDLSTVYSAGVARDARATDSARRFASLLTGATSLPLRIAAGFEISR
jgi:molybdate transport system substrate-binding protein